MITEVRVKVNGVACVRCQLPGKLKKFGQSPRARRRWPSAFVVDYGRLQGKYCTFCVVALHPRRKEVSRPADRCEVAEVAHLLPHRTCAKLTVAKSREDLTVATLTMAM